MGETDDRITTLKVRESQLAGGPRPGGAAGGQLGKGYRDALDALSERQPDRDAHLVDLADRRNAVLEELASTKGELSELERGRDALEKQQLTGPLPPDSAQPADAQSTIKPQPRHESPAAEHTLGTPQSPAEQELAALQQDLGPPLSASAASNTPHIGAPPDQDALPPEYPASFDPKGRHPQDHDWTAGPSGGGWPGAPGDPVRRDWEEYQKEERDRKDIATPPTFAPHLASWPISQDRDHKDVGTPGTGDPARGVPGSGSPGHPNPAPLHSSERDGSGEAVVHRQVAPLPDGQHAFNISPGHIERGNVNVELEKYKQHVEALDRITEGFKSDMATQRQDIVVEDRNKRIEVHVLAAAERLNSEFGRRNSEITDLSENNVREPHVRTAQMGFHGGIVHQEIVKRDEVAREVLRPLAELNVDERNAHTLERSAELNQSHLERYGMRVAGAPDADVRLKNFAENLERSQKELDDTLRAENPQQVEKEIDTLRRQHLPELRPPGIAAPSLAQSGPASGPRGPDEPPM